MSKPGVCGWVLLFSGIFGAMQVMAEKPADPAGGELLRPSAERHSGSASALTPARRAKIEREAEELSERRFGDPDLAEQFYVNSRVGPLRTRGPSPTVGIGTISPEMYYPALQHMRKMPRISSGLQQRYPALAEANASSIDPFAGTPPEAVGTWTNLGPSTQGGRTRALLIDPGNPSMTLPCTAV